jgi:penicillin amidase
MRRRLLKALGAVLLFAVAGALGVFAVLRRSLPQVNGVVALGGPSAPIEIIRDADNVPHIFGRTRRDALFGLGYVHAQDRLWQMEMQRRIGHGRLSEIFGAATIPQDRFLRTVGFGRAARAAWDRLPADAREQIDAYVAGVNAFIASHHGTTLPPEFLLLRFEPEPFTGPDVLAWVKMMAWDLSANYSFELLRHDLAAKVGPDRARELMPPYATHGLSILDFAGEPADVEGHAADGAAPMRSSARFDPSTSRPPSRPSPPLLPALLASLEGGSPEAREFLLGSATTEALGSNNWVVDGSMTTSGKPLLANDPHLGTRLPSTWYLAHVSGGDLEVIGATLPGTPAVALGRNRHIAWGATNVAADVEDLYREKLDATGEFAEFRGVPERVTHVIERIGVKGGQPVWLDVRITRHGPLISDAINANNAALPERRRPPVLEPLSFRWTALDPDDTTILAFLHINDAKNWDEFSSALRDFVVPSQNFVYADVDGHIGYYAPGRIPIRASGDGSTPQDGWTGAGEWNGWVPFNALPHAFDPPSHFIVTANNRPAGPGYPYLLGLEWAEPYRAQRIVNRLLERPRFSTADFAAIQADTESLHATSLLPVLAQRAHPVDPADREAIATVRHWNGDARGDSAAAAIFEAWFLRLAPTIVGDELGPAVTENYQGRFSYVSRFLARTLASADDRWCDDVRTPKKETCDDAVTAALHDAVVDLKRRLGSDQARWRWDALHRAVFPHQGLDAVPVLGALLRQAAPNGGDWSTVDVGTVATDHWYEQRAVPGYRQIIDLSPANDSRFMNDLGESGHPLSPYGAYLNDWHAVRHRAMRMTREDIERGAVGHLTLVPGGH